jgi:hypothetical protein
VQAVALLKQMPPTVGEWQGTRLPDLEDREVRLAGFAGYVLRRYQRPDGAAVSVLLTAPR